MRTERRLAVWRAAALLLLIACWRRPCAAAQHHQQQQPRQQQQQQPPQQQQQQRHSTEPPSCPSCRKMREKMRMMTLEAIKESILRKLGMKQCPNVTGRQLPRIPPLDHLYAVQADQPFRPGPAFSEEHDDYSATTEKVIAFAQPHPRLRHERKDVLYFKFSEKVEASRVMRAHLWLFLKGGPPGEPPVNIALYRIANPDNPHLKTPPEVSIREMRPTNSGGRWISIEMRKVVSEWFKFPRENLGLVVEASVPGRDIHSQHLIVTSSIYEESSLTPFLEVHTAEGRRRRTKRTVGLNCSENSTETLCCRYPLLVDFEELDWDWVLAPRRYEAYYCSGECSPVLLPTSPHTHLMQIGTPPDTAGNCCAPRKMSSISMLYYDTQQSISFGQVPNMVVDRCGCY